MLIPSKFIKADFDAVGGAAAVAAEARGNTQKVRITQHLAWVIQQELTGGNFVTEANPLHRRDQPNLSLPRHRGTE